MLKVALAASAVTRPEIRPECALRVMPARHPVREQPDEQVARLDSHGASNTLVTERRAMQGGVAAKRGSSGVKQRRPTGRQRGRDDVAVGGAAVVGRVHGHDVNVEDRADGPGRVADARGSCASKQNTRGHITNRSATASIHCGAAATDSAQVTPQAGDERQAELGRFCEGIGLLVAKLVVPHSTM